ncbi:hypothetical protein F5B22DRAFT_285629 [Xylaria bambusicola]|uniref:uncharacterized protein n=1 Tax=Xylaria bambusicola TaxID=326684 RepID=UPI00200760E1|nr:uncharacterized protein F5B22DRAFT_285629 [Xylaria bambusicola]KAI0513063.1 hypothetical protein F5B22DRAFT_285629 [Xylaria bambusicola]
MLSTPFQSVFAAFAVTAAARLIQVPFNNYAHLSPDIDGPWPTLRVDYEDSQDNLTLNTYLTLANASLLIRPHTCGDEVEDGKLRCGEFTFPEAYHNVSTAKQTRLPELTDSFLSNVSYLTPWDEFSLNSRQGLDFFRFMSFNGLITGINFTSNLAGHRIETPAIVGEKLATQASNNSHSVPLLNSMISLPNMASSLSEAGRVSSPFSSFHMGSVEPPVNGSLIIGGYDNKKIMGDLLNWTETYNTRGNPSGNLVLTHIYIGVDSGFLPLDSLRLNNQSFPQGPYKQDPSLLRDRRNFTTTEIIIEPGSPYLHLNHGACGQLAGLLDLEYDATRNLYLWSYPPDHPIFRSPVYLEFVLRPYWDDYDLDESQAGVPEVSIKVPIASLQHTFHATTRAINGSLLPPARYFPCSHHDSEWSNGWYTWPRLGRAFLQSAFLASSFKYNDDADTVANYWLAQAPGPGGIGGNLAADLIEVTSGTIPNRTGVKLEANAWTRSWSSVLPMWTLDYDGVTTLDQLNMILEAPHQNNLGLKVAVSIVGTAVVLVALFFGVKGIRRSRINNARVKREIEEEDATAREIERLSLLKKEEAEAVSRASTDDRPTSRYSLSVSSLSDDESRVLSSSMS